jgi:aspartate/methionine/tyrosine aminotransferase
LRYAPHPLGAATARDAVANYYSSNNIRIDPSNVVFTASTSEAYGWLFMLLCEAGANVLVPTPSYPLFEFLARLHDVDIHPYHLRYDGEWSIELDSVRHSLSPTTRAIVVVTPHNPTGMFLKQEDLHALNRIAGENGLALIVDEVFSEYAMEASERRVASTATNEEVLTFTLNGISKLCGLPQMKLGWIVASGPAAQRQEALQRIEIIADTFLSVNTPVQVALPELLELGKRIRAQIHERVRANYRHLVNAVSVGSPVSVLHTEGGWYAILKMPRTRSDEEWAIRLLDTSGVYVFPGYFFDFAEGGLLVVSLLTQPEILHMGMEEIRKHAGE